MTYNDHRTSGSVSGGLGFTLGGFQRLSAYAPDQFSGNYLLYGRITYLNDRVNAPGLRTTVFGSSPEVGDVWLRRRNFGSGPYKSSASLFIGGNSVIGPLYFGVAAAPQGVEYLPAAGPRVLARLADQRRIAIRRRFGTILDRADAAVG
jgi:NTE family protein